MLDRWIDAKERKCICSFAFIVAKPEPPSIVSVLPSSNRAVVKWKFGDNGGLALISLTLEYRVSTDKKWQSLQLTPADRTQYTITELEPDNNYQFRIRAENKLGKSEPSVAYIAQTSKAGRSLLVFLFYSQKVRPLQFMKLL